MVAGRPVNNLLGVAWMVATALSLTTMYIAARQLSPEMSTFQIVFFRAVAGILILLPWLMRNGVSALRTQNPLLHAGRGLCTFGAISFLFYGVANAPLADATALQAVYPLITIVLVVIVLGEPCGRARWLAALAGFVGLLVIVRPGFAVINQATLALLACSLCYAASNLFVKLLARTADQATMMVFSLNAFILLFSAVPVVFVWVTPDWSTAPWIALLALAGFSAQSCMTRAMLAGEASVVMPFDYLRLPFAALAGFLLYAEVPDLPAILGATIIVGSVVYIGATEARLKSKPGGPA